jgi:hypothetical protein
MYTSIIKELKAKVLQLKSLEKYKHSPALYYEISTLYQIIEILVIMQRKYDNETEI